MKALVFSDIHGSLPVARRMVELAGRHLPDAVVILGDVLYHGPRNELPEGYAPGKTAEALAPLADRIMAVKGNCDSEVDETVLPFALASPCLWLYDGTPGAPMRILAVHGHLSGPHNLPRLAPGDVLLSGHTHVPTATTSPEGIHLCNPGSMALPKEGSPPCYGLMDGGVFTVIRADTDEPYRTLDCRKSAPGFR